jgi:hypothetical protein
MSEPVDQMLHFKKVVIAAILRDKEYQALINSEPYKRQNIQLGVSWLTGKLAGADFIKLTHPTCRVPESPRLG